MKTFPPKRVLVGEGDERTFSDEFRRYCRETGLSLIGPETIAVLVNLPSNRKAHELVFDYSGRGSLRGAWNNVCKPAGIQRLTRIIAATPSQP